MSHFNLQQNIPKFVVRCSLFVVRCLSLSQNAVQLSFVSLSRSPPPTPSKSDETFMTSTEAKICQNRILSSNCVKAEDCKGICREHMSYEMTCEKIDGTLRCICLRPCG